MKNQSGIYEILNTANGKRYIGSAVHFARRWYLHCWKLNRGEHHSAKLQNAWNKHGAGAALSLAKTGKPGTPISAAHLAKLQAGYVAYRARLRDRI